MKKLILYSLLIVFTFCSFKKGAIPADAIQLEVKKVRSQVVNEKKCMVVDATLRNISSDTVWFANMTCSYIQAFILDSKQERFPGWDCDKNFMEIYAIAPGKTKDYELHIYSISQCAGSCIFRVGFRWVLPENKKAHPLKVESQDDFTYTKEIIWSNALTFNVD